MSGDSLLESIEAQGDSVETAPPKAKRTRRSQLTITGGIASPETIKPHENHPLHHLGPDERLQEALKALGSLILRAVGGGATTDIK